MRSTDLLVLIGRDVPLRRAASTNGGEYTGPCPFCGGHEKQDANRFHVWPQAGRWWCRKCNRSGDDIQYIRERDAVGYPEACRRLGLETLERSRSTAVAAPVPPSPVFSLLSAPDAAWQGRGAEFVAAAEETLWKPAGRRALDWLHQRCLSDDTIRAAQLGYHDTDVWEPPSTWGLSADHKKIWLPKGIVIPWWIRGALWRVNIRRPQGDPKYVGPAGWSKCLYNADTLGGDRPAVLVEGEIDALTVMQCASEVVAAVATGSTSGARHMRWIGRLALAPLVLVAFDCDDGGEKGAAFWLERLSLARRWRPLWADVNQMAQSGADVRRWVLAGISHHDPGLARRLEQNLTGNPGEPIRIKLNALMEFLSANQLEVCGGDPDLVGKPWHSKISAREHLQHDDTG